MSTPKKPRKPNPKKETVKARRAAELAEIKRVKLASLADAALRVQALGDEAEQKLLKMVRQELKMKLGAMSPYINALRLALERAGRIKNGRSVELKQEKDKDGGTVVRVVWDEAPKADDGDDD
ncbi:MAG: hypothetical protein RLZZ127_52 [Planctomycetota bacterium]|jgi:hypothetical protein